MASIRNEDYRQLSAFYANPERFINVENKYTPGRADNTKDYSWKEGSNTVKKALDRFEENYGGYDDLLEDARGFDKYSKSQFRDLNSTADGESPWVDGTAPFFEAFKDYDHFEERYKEKRAKEKPDEKPEAPEPTKAPERYTPSTKYAQAKSRAKAYKDKAVAIGDVMTGKTAFENIGAGDMQQSQKPGVTSQGTTNGTDYGFDVMDADPDGPERRQLILS